MTSNNFCYPEHTKLREFQEKTSDIYKFLYWCLAVKNMKLVPDSKIIKEGASNDLHYHAGQEDNIHNLLYEYFKIDSVKLDCERKAMMDSLKNMKRIHP